MDFYSEQLQVYINKHQNTDDIKILNNMDEKIRLLLQLIQRVQSDTHKIQQDKIKTFNEKALLSNQISSKNSNTSTTFNPFKLANHLTLGDSYVVPQKQNQVPLFQLPAAPVTQQFTMEQKLQGKPTTQDNQQYELLAYQSQEQLSNNQEREYSAEDYMIENQKKYQQMESKEQIYKNNNNNINNNNNKFNKKRKQNEQYDDNFNKMNCKDIAKSHMNDNVNEYEQIQKIQIQDTQPRLLQTYGSSKSAQQQQQQMFQQQQHHFQMPNQNINSINQTYSQIQQQQLQINPQQTQIHSQHNQNSYQLLQNGAINQEESNFFSQKEQLTNTNNNNNNNNNSIQGSNNNTLNNTNFQTNHSNLASNFNAVQIQGQTIKIYPNKTSSNHNLNSQSNNSSGSYSHSHSHSHSHRQQSKSQKSLNKNNSINQMNQNQIENNNEQISLNTQNNQLSHHEQGQPIQENTENFINYYPNQPNQPSQQQKKQQQQMSIQQLNQEQSQIFHNHTFLMSCSSNDTQQKLASDDQSIDLYCNHESFHETAHQKNKANMIVLSNTSSISHHNHIMHHSKSMGDLQIKMKKQNLNNIQQHTVNMAETESDNQNSNLIQSQDLGLKASDISMITLEQKILMSKSLGESDRNVGNNQSQNTFITDIERTKNSNNNSNFLSNSITLNNMQSTINSGRQELKICKKEEEYSEYENETDESESEQTPLANQDFKFKNDQLVQQNSKGRAFDTRNVIKNLLTFLKKYLISLTIPQNLLAWQAAQADFREYITNYKGNDVKSSRSIIQNYPLVNSINEIENDQLRQDLELRLQNFPIYPLNEQIRRINYFNSLVRRYSMTYLTVIMPQIIQKNGMFIQKESIQRFSQLFLSYIKNPTSYLRIQS
ncbi:hypothetical protein ABPG72_020649 [Tetrahymena utriculariae]